MAEALASPASPSVKSQVSLPFLPMRRVMSEPRLTSITSSALKKRHTIAAFDMTPVTTPSAVTSPLVTRRRFCQVSFSEDPAAEVDVTPYSAIYGEHPKGFNFDRSGERVPAALLPVAELRRRLPRASAATGSSGSASGDAPEGRRRYTLPSAPPSSPTGAFADALRLAEALESIRRASHSSGAVPARARGGARARASSAASSIGLLTDVGSGRGGAASAGDAASIDAGGGSASGGSTSGERVREDARLRLITELRRSAVARRRISSRGSDSSGVQSGADVIVVEEPPGSTCASGRLQIASESESRSKDELEARDEESRLERRERRRLFKTGLLSMSTGFSSSSRGDFGTEAWRRPGFLEGATLFVYEGPGPPSSPKATTAVAPTPSADIAQGPGPPSLPRATTAGATTPSADIAQGEDAR